jgi:hypothetical protein
MIALKRQQFCERNNEKKATIEQLKRSKAVTLKSPGSGPLFCLSKGGARGSSGSLRKRHSKAMGAPRQHARREVRIGVRLPANHDEIADKVLRKMPL